MHMILYVLFIIIPHNNIYIFTIRFVNIIRHSTGNTWRRNPRRKMIWPLLGEVSVYRAWTTAPSSTAALLLFDQTPPVAAAATRRKLDRPTSPPPPLPTADLFSQEPPAVVETAMAATAAAVSNHAPSRTTRAPWRHLSRAREGKIKRWLICLET